MCAKGTVREGLYECVAAAIAGLHLLCKKGLFPTSHDLGQGQAVGAGPWLCCVEDIDFGELGVACWAQELGIDKGSDGS